MPSLQRRDPLVDRREEMKKRMIRETEAFLNRQLRQDRRTKHRGDLIEDRKTDPRDVTRPSATETSPPKPTVQSIGGGSLIPVPANDLGHLDRELLDRWSICLSRVVHTPHRGHVLLDMTGVASVTSQFVPVYEWFRSHLQKQGRKVTLHLNGACMEDPEPGELCRAIKVTDEF